MDKAVWCLSKTPGKRTSTYCTRAEGQKNNWNQFNQYRQRPSAGTSGGRTTVSPHGRAGLSSLPLGSGLPSVPEAATAGRRSENTYPPILGLSWVSVTNLALLPALEPTPPLRRARAQKTSGTSPRSGSLQSRRRKGCRESTAGPVQSKGGIAAAGII